jgi:signal transduction histidine kinase
MSVRLRITAIAAAITIIVLAATAGVVVLVVQSQLRTSLDRSLAQRADQVAAAAGIDPGAAVTSLDREDRFAQILDAGGGVVAASENVGGRPALAELPDGRQSVATRHDIPIEDDIFRVLVRRVDLRGEPGFVVVGENVDDVTDAVRSLLGTLAIAVPTAVLVLAAAVWWLIGRTLRPVESIRREVAAIGLDELDHRVPSPGTGDEIDRLAGTMNDMLARLEAATGSQRRFVADVSHELRTPLTRMRTTLEVELSRAGHRDPEAACRAVLGDAIEMQDLVDDLLFLARSDAGTVVRRMTPIDLDVVVEGEVRRTRESLDGRPRIDTTAVGSAVVDGDAAQLTRLVRNLVSNAVRHAADEVRIAVTTTGGTALLSVDDDGPGVREADRARVFDRFVRLDQARSSRGGGTGLGLAIVRDIVTAHGGTVAITTSPLGGARLEVRLPTTEPE